MQLMPMSTETSADDGLIRAAAEGDRSAFGELYLRYARMVHGILLARVPAGDAEDLVQPPERQPGAHAQPQLDELVVAEGGVQTPPERVVHAEMIGREPLGELRGQRLPPGQA